MYLILKHTHMTLAVLAISGFLLRGYWMASGSPIRQYRATKIVPHVVDALLLATGIWLAVLVNVNVPQSTWLLAKFAGLFAYIGFGMVAFRFGKTQGIRLIAFIAAVAAFAYIVGAAVSKSPLGWLAL